MAKPPIHSPNASGAPNNLNFRILGGLPAMIPAHWMKNRQKVCAFVRGVKTPGDFIGWSFNAVKFSEHENRISH